MDGSILDKQLDSTVCDEALSFWRQSKSSKSSKSNILQKPQLLNRQFIGLSPISKPRSFAQTKDGTIYLCGLNSAELYLLDPHEEGRDFKLKSVARLDFNTRDIAVHPVSDVLYAVLDDNSVTSVNVSTGSSTKLFVPEGKPRALAFMNDGRMLVGDFDKPMVTVYSPELEKITTIAYEGEIHLPTRRIAVCRTTEVIAITCVCSYVIVMDCNFTELYRYTDPSGDLAMQPFDIVFDRHGYMLVSDYRVNYGVHIVNVKTGTYVQYLRHTGMGYAQCLTLTRDDHVVVGTICESQLLTFKYLE